MALEVVYLTKQQAVDDDTTTNLIDIKITTYNLYVKPKGLLYDEQAGLSSSSSQHSVASV